MAAQKVLVVPGMPMAALNNVRDENTRQVLDALVAAHNVRNGATGKGDDRFITAAELGLVNGNTRVIIDAGGGASQPNTPLLSPAAINRIIADLQASVIESPLFKDLGERVDLIDKPGGIFDQLQATEVALINETSSRITADTAEVQARQALGARVGNNEAAILTETLARVNSDNAIAQSVTTQFAAVGQSLGLVQTSVTTISNNVAAISTQVNQVQASVGTNSAAIQAESTARVTADGQINAKYTVKIDVNGYVAGYGLMSTANNAVPFSDFIVRADRFAIGSPSGPGIAPKVPFIVTTTPSTVGGETVPPGVYIEDAIIKNGSIGRAKIGDLQVDTLKIAGASVTVGTYDAGGSATVPASSGTIIYQTLITRTMDLGDGYNTGLIMIGAIQLFAGTNATYGVRLLVNGQIAGEQRGSLQGGFVYLSPVIGFAPATGRYATIQLQAYNVETGPGSNVPLTINNSSIAILGAKR